MTKHTRAAFVATVTLIGGVTASLAGNVQAINLDNHQPGVGATISAVVWPLALFLSVEMLLHTPWLNNWRDHLTKLATVAIVAGMAAYISYFHLAHVLSSYGYDVASRYAGPLAIDAAMVMAALALNRVGHARKGQDVPAAAPDMDISADALPAVNVPAEDMDIMTQPLPVVDMDTAADRAIGQAGQELAGETEHWLSRLSAGLDNTTTPAVPVVSGQDTLPRRTRGKADNAQLTYLVELSLESGAYSAKDVDTLLSTYYGVSDRTVRRVRAGLTGKPVSGVPAQDGQE